MDSLLLDDQFLDLLLLLVKLHDQFTARLVFFTSNLDLLLNPLDSFLTQSLLVFDQLQLYFAFHGLGVGDRQSLLQDHDVFLDGHSTVSGNLLEVTLAVGDDLLVVMMVVMVRFMVRMMMVVTRMMCVLFSFEVTCVLFFI